MLEKLIAKIPKLSRLKLRTFPRITYLLALLAIGLLIYSLYQTTVVNSQIKKLNELEKQLSLAQTEARDLKNRDEYKINQDLKKEIVEINKTYKEAVTTYESLNDLSQISDKTDRFEKEFAQVLVLLSERNFASAEAKLTVLDKELRTEKDRLLLSFAKAANLSSIANVSSSNTPPGSGYSRQKVSVLGSSYLVDIVAADLGSTRVIVDTSSDGDCRDNCPVLPLSDYVARNGAFAGVNGSYFCPASYPSCVGKANSFDTLLMNKNKVYFNSDNNVYSSVPAVIFLPGGIRFVGASSEWGRDTGVDGVLANQPLLLSGGNVVFGGDDDPKKGAKGGRSFVGSKGITVYIGVVHSASIAESAHVLKALGLENALNLDNGGSTAFWAGGYRAGPGRNIPNAILFLRR